MFNQEMPSDYKPRKYMVRGVLNTQHGVMYEIVYKGRAVKTFLVYSCACLFCDSMNKA